MPLPLAEFYPPELQPSAPPEPHAGAPPYCRRTLDPHSAAEVARQLRARPKLRYSESIPQALVRVHAAWSSVRSPWRAQAVRLLHGATGYPEAVLDRSIRKLFASLRSAEALAGWSPPASDRVRTYGPALTVIVSSGNIPGAALPSVVQALLLQSPCLVKTASAEPFLLPLYARSLAELAPALAERLVVTHWTGGDEAVESAVLAEAEALIAYGSDASLAQLRGRLPAQARFIGYGHRLSFSAIAADCLTRGAVRRLALDVALDAAIFDQQGCLSPQAVYVEKGGEVSPEAFGECVAVALARLERIIPRRKLSAAEASTIHQYRADVEMRAFTDSELRLWASPGGTAWTAALERDATLLPCPLNRTVILRPVPALEELPGHLSGAGGMLLSAGLAAPAERRTALAALLAEQGVTRITRIGRAQEPVDALRHDGVHAMAALARYVVEE